MKRVITFILVFCLLASLGSAFADSSGSRAVIGADLTDEQVTAVYYWFGIDRGSVPEMVMTNTEERYYLENLVEDGKIGTRSISSVYIQILEEGSGVQVETHNINYCTEQNYAAALTTAGVKNAKVIVAAPFEVSGTAALAGVYKAYEEITGKELDENAKLISTQELIITSELTEQLGNADTGELVNALLELMSETKDWTDEQLSAEIRAFARENGYELSDDEVELVLRLYHSLEGLDSKALAEKIDSAKKTIQNVAEAKEKAGETVEKAKNIFEKEEYRTVLFFFHISIILFTTSGASFILRRS